MNEKIYYSIDRIESNIAVCQNMNTEEIINIDMSLLPNNVKTGDIIYLENGTYYIDIQKTTTNQDEIKNMVNNLFNKK